VLDRLNALRRERAESTERHTLEADVETRYHAAIRLAVYGTLAPGQPNHHVISGLAGRWLEGTVRGTLHAAGWGASAGYPALRIDPNGAAVPVHLLVSDDLPANWRRLDDFEGPGYRRILVPVHADGGELMAVANLYEAAP